MYKSSSLYGTTQVTENGLDILDYIKIPEIVSNVP